MKLDDLIKFLEKNWYTLPGLIAAEIVSFVTIAGLLINSKAGFEVSAFTTTVVFLFIFSLWAYSRRIPKTKKGRIGVVVAIKAEDDSESRQIRNDFIQPLRENLSTTNRGKFFQLIELRPHHTGQIDTISDAERFQVQMRAQFFIFGTVRVRRIGGQEHHVMNLSGWVAHPPIAEKSQKSLEKEFSELFPQRVNISRDNDVLGFEYTSKWASLVAKYIIGFAAAVSGDLTRAEQLYRETEQDIKSLTQNDCRRIRHLRASA